MPNRPSFQPRYQLGAQAGGSSFASQSGVNAVPSSFLPDYSGDGYGKAMKAGLTPQPITGDGQGRRSEEQQPVWSGDGRRQVANPMMPTWNPNNPGANFPGSGFERGRAQQPAPKTTAPEQQAEVRGDGQSKPAVHLSDDLVMNVNVGGPEVDSPDLESQVDLDKSPRSETWKLVALVVVFLVWISTASTLLFLYMDRYLFP